ncbi:unnamed protein product, partial [Pocillopora meandrina]
DAPDTEGSSATPSTSLNFEDAESLPVNVLRDCQEISVTAAPTNHAEDTVCIQSESDITNSFTEEQQTKKIHHYILCKSVTACVCVSRRKSTHQNNQKEADV